MPRSARVSKKFVPQVKSKVKNFYSRQKDLAEELGLALATVSNFLNGKPVDHVNFREICHKLGLNWQDIADREFNASNNTNTLETDFLLEVTEEFEDFIYVERPPIESLCYQTLHQPGALLRIKAPGWMGKTSLANRILPLLAQSGYRTVLLNLHSTHSNHFNNLDRFLQCFCVSVGKSLRLSNQLADYWDEEFSSSKINCTEYFEEYLLAQSDTPLVLWLDEVERIFPYKEVAADFLGLLRVWHEQAKIRPIWKNLRLVVAHSTEVYVQLNVNESPFNVGVSIDLPEFTPEQVKRLAAQYELNWSWDEIQQLMNLVGGHPHLLGKTCLHLKRNPNTKLSKILETAATEAGIYRNYLRHYWNVIQQDPELVKAFRKVVEARDNIYLEPTQTYKLHSMGLVKLSGNEIRIFCNLYHQYFRYCFEMTSC